MSDRALSRTAFCIWLVVHCLAGLPLFLLLVFFVPRFEALFADLTKRGELPSLTLFVLLASGYWAWLLGVGFFLDAAVLYAIGRLPRKLRPLAVAWFSLVLFVIVILLVLTVVGLLLPVQKMSTAL